MSDEKKTPAKTAGKKPVIPLAYADVDKLLACADGMAALLYLHIVRTGSLSVAQAARDLRCPGDEVERAAEVLRRLDMLPQDSTLPPANELPMYSREEVSVQAEKNPEIEGIIQEAQHTLGRMLSENEMRIFYGMYDHLALPAEVIYMLIHYVVDTSPPGKISAWKFEREAYRWVQEGATTCEAAESYLVRTRQLREAMRQTASLMKLGTRPLSPSEESYLSNWLGKLGFTPEVIGEAYDRTVIQTGTLAWNYMNTILTSWKDKNLMTLEDISQADARRAQTTGPNTSSSARHQRRVRQAPPQQMGSSEDIANMRRLYESMKGGG